MKPALILLTLAAILILWPRRRESEWDEEPDGIQVDPRPASFLGVKTSDRCAHTYDVSESTFALMRGLPSTGLPRTTAKVIRCEYVTNHEGGHEGSVDDEGHHSMGWGAPRRAFTLVAGAGHAAIPHRPGGWANDCPMCEVQVRRFLDDVRRGRRD